MSNFIYRLITSIFLMTALLFIFFYLPPIALSVVLLLILLEILLLEWPRLCANTPNLWLLTPIYPVLPFILLILLNHTHHLLLFFLIASVAAFDSGAYCAGKLFGNRKIAPTISPGKTWEGFFGGYLAACGMAAAIHNFLDTKTEALLPFLFTIAIICILALLGDLFESWLKRKAGIKDTGSILPGHGGFLDRMDGLLFAVFFLYVIYPLIP